MRKHLLSFCFIALLAVFMTVSVSAAEVASGTCGETLTWTLDDQGVLTVTGSGEMEDYPDWGGQKNRIRTVSLPAGLTSVGCNAFGSCVSLTHINLPGGLESIGAYAFINCTRLELPPIPGTVTAIGEYAFSRCSLLRSVIIPEGVTEIAEGTFDACENLHSVALPEELTEIGPFAFSGCPLTSVVLPATLRSIGSGAFYNCPLASIAFPESLTDIDKYAFRGCAFTSIALPENLDSISEQAFYDCAALTSLTVPADIGYISDDAFRLCGKLKDLYFCGSEARWAELVPASAAYHIFEYYDNINIHCDAIPITRHPADATVTADGSAKFTVKAEGTGLTYQWQYSTDGGKTWKNNNCTKATFTINPVGEWRHGYRYRCIITQGERTAVSLPATLTVAPAVITAQPESVVTAADEEVSFSVSASGADLRYRWQFSTDNGATWLNNSCTAETFTLDSPGKWRDGYLYRCKITGADGAVFSAPAVLTVTPARLTPPVITLQPKPVSAAPDGSVKFSVAAEGRDLTYQWQYKAPGKGWVNNSCKTAAFTISAPGTWRDGYQYRCKVSNAAGTVYSQPASLTVASVSEPLEITGQPRSISVNAADTAKFTVKATGTGLIYQWQYKAPGKGWQNNACTKATLTLNPAQLWRDGYRYRCVITDADGNILVSTAAALTVN